MNYNVLQKRFNTGLQKTYKGKKFLKISEISGHGAGEGGSAGRQAE